MMAVPVASSMLAETPVPLSEVIFCTNEENPYETEVDNFTLGEDEKCVTYLVFNTSSLAPDEKYYTHWRTYGPNDNIVSDLPGSESYIGRDKNWTWYWWVLDQNDVIGKP